MQNIETVRKITILSEVPYVQKQPKKDDHSSKRKGFKKWQRVNHIGGKNRGRHN